MTTALLLVDAQRNMLEGDAPIPGASDLKLTLEALLAQARMAGAIVVHVQNDGPPGSPDEPHTTGWELVLPPDTGEVVVRKEVGDAFAANPELALTLGERGVDQVIVAGLQSEFCIQETSRGAMKAGFKVFLPHGAHGTYDDGTSAAAEVANAVERELAADGVEVLGLAEVDFA
jgi:nicotinamidase-related amidase